jgi:multimeric flavodoxin WrbA
MPRLLVVHHVPSDNLGAVADAALEGTRAEGIVGVEVVVRPALEATADDALGADGYLLGTPANLGYMSGALKHFFDTVYRPCLDVTAGRPAGFWVHGESDTTGAVLGIEKVLTGLRWRLVRPPLSLIGAPTHDDLEAAWDLGATVAVSLMEG